MFYLNYDWKCKNKEIIEFIRGTANKILKKMFKNHWVYRNLGQQDYIFALFLIQSEIINDKNEKRFAFLLLIDKKCKYYS